jgi:putative membrane protein
MGNILPTISTCFIVISAVLVAFGWAAIVKGQQEKHQKLMLAGAVFALLFFLIYVSRTVFVGNTSFSEDAPTWVRDAYFVFLIFHITLATVSGVFGIVTLLQAFKKNFAKHKRIGRWTAVMWLCTAPTGVMVYVLLYIMYPGGTTKPVFDAIFGS